MPRIRYLKPEFFKDEDLAELKFEVRLFYAGLWGLADKAGRLEDRPKRFKAEIFPYDNVDAEKCLDALSKPKNGSGKPFLHRYEVDGQRYIQIIEWAKHQKPHHTEKESEIPAAPEREESTKEEKEKTTITITEKQLEATAELNNGSITVNEEVHKRDEPNTIEEKNLELARKLWPGKKRTFRTEFENFKKHHKDWRDLLDDDGLRDCVQILIDRKAYSPGYWPMFATWTNQNRYEEALQPPEVRK